ncbi:MAG: nitroreductase family protein [Bacteroidetes bacterium]|nr:nitroreductase family protein [Bacteroidota bacterium]MCW5894766.1 nitroreductase family protein [Bacteroidota bacterium]
MQRFNVIPLDFQNLPEEEQLRRAKEFLDLCRRRRSVREFSDKPVSRELIETIIATAGTAPSGANKQPWKFVLVDDPNLKREIRIAAEREEKESYEHRMPQDWLDDLEPLGTDWHKEFLEVAPCLIVVFKEKYRMEEGKQKKNYYVEESVGIACGFLLAAIHNAGLASLTHTPSPMNFLRDILQRPANEVPYLLIPVGYPKEGVKVPDLHRKKLGDILITNPLRIL